MKTKNKGYILSVVLCTVLLLMIIVGSLFELINSQRKLSVKKEDLLQADNAAETAIDYAYSCVINDINTKSISHANSVPATGYKEFTFDSAVTNFITNTPTMATGYTGKISNLAYSNLSVRVLPIGPLTRYFGDPTDPSVDPKLANQWVYERLVPVVARVTASQSGRSYTAYVQKSIACQEIDLFQYSIFFQGQLHMHRGFRPMGAVHTNGMLFLNAQDGDHATYNGAISAAGHIYRGSTFDVTGTGSNGYGYVPIDVNGDADFSTSMSPRVVPKATGTSNQLQILVGGTTGTSEFGMGNSISPNEGEDVHTDPNHWKKWATDNFKNNLLDKSHEVPSITLVGAAGYAQDIASTTDINEFNNGPYQLLEPTFPSTSAYDAPIRMTSNGNNLEANATLVLIVEYNNGPNDATHATFADTDTAAVNAAIYLHRRDNGKYVEVRNGKVYSIEATAATPADLTGSRPTLSLYSDPWRMFVVKGYRVKTGWSPTDSSMKDVHDYIGAITLPDKVFGAASANVLSVAPTADLNLKMEDFDVALSGAYTLASTINTTGTTTPVAPTPMAAVSSGDKNTINTNNNLIVTITKGLFDSRLGRGVAPLTIDIDALKDILEADISSFANPSHNRTFRTDFDPTAADATYKKWNGLVYIEFPTSLTVDTTSATNAKNEINTLRFSYSSSPELRHPDRSVETLAADGRVARTDNIVPIAPELRRYPDTSATIPMDPSLNSTILDAQYAIPAVQLINGRFLPHPNLPVAPAVNTEGFTIATNVPVYLVGNYNSDGDYATGSNITSDAPGAYATLETGEIPAAIFCDMFTVLSNGWGSSDGTHPQSNRQNSFYGANNGSTADDGTSIGNVGSPPGRPAKSLAARTITHFSAASYTYPKSNPDLTMPYVEISACIATGEYPIFEFFTHALENYQPMYDAMATTKANPIIFKGSMVGMFHSEIQHIKQAYGRSVASNVQTGSIWRQHGAYAIAGSRFTQYLVDGLFPPGTPKAYLTAQKEFSLLHWSNPTDATLLTQAGFTP